MIPLISSACYGPLEVGQLPRFWWKVLLRRAGLLDAEYPDCGSGLDAAVLNLLGLEKEATLAYLREEMPTYLDFEAWVVERVGETLDRESVRQWNEHLRAREHTRPEKIAETYRDIGFSEEVTIRSATLLNCLQDWQLFYKRDLSDDFSGLGGRVVPLISTMDFGPLGVYQLPRTWLKILLHAKGLLHPDYPHMTENGFDPRAVRVLGLEPGEVVSYVCEHLPTYLQFEAWIVERTGGRIDRERVEEWNGFLRTRTPSDQRRAQIHAYIGRTDDGSLTSGAILNHVEDWHYAHKDLMSRFSG